MRRRALTVLGLCALLRAAAPPARGEGSGAGSIAWDEGSRALVDTWTQDDGCPARTGATQSAPFGGPREVAWRASFSGEVEGDPLVWKGKTFVVERTGGSRALHVLSTATGQKISRHAFDTGGLPLAPCVQDGRVVVRSSPRTLQGFVVGEKGLASKWKVVAKSGMGPPTFVRDEVYAVVDGVLQRRTFGSKDVSWPKGDGGVKAAGAPASGKGVAKGTREYPRPSLRGGSVFLATEERLVEVDRSTGSVRRDAVLAAGADPRARVCVGYCDVVVQASARFEEGGRKVDTARFGRFDAGALVRKTPHATATGWASIGCDWVCALDKKDGSPVLARVNGPDDAPDGSVDLATRKFHPEFLEAKVPPTAAGDVVFCGGRTFDAEQGDVLEIQALPCVSRVVPLRTRLIVVEAKNRVVAWRSVRETASQPPLALADAATTGPARVALDDGRVVAGDFGLDLAARTLRLAAPGAKEAKGNVVPWSAVRALVTDAPSRRLLLASSPDAAAEGTTSIVRSEIAPDLERLLVEAVASGDGRIAQRVHAAAAQVGVPEAALDAAEVAIANLGAAGSEAGDRTADLEARLKALLLREPDVLVEAAGSVPSGDTIRYATALVRAAVDAYAFHAGVTAWVRSRLPPGLSPDVIHDPRDWLLFLERLATTKVEIFGPGGKGTSAPPPPVAEALEEARSKWREDVVGFQQGPLLIVTPGERPDIVVRCLDLGRIAGGALDEAFSSVGPRRTDDEVLVLHLFGNKDEYVIRSQSGEPGHGGIGQIEMTAGHYDPRANVTRIFVPTRTYGAHAVFGTYVHELTHHWVARRRPLPPGTDDVGDRAGGPGFFIVEGIADFLQAFSIDVEAGTTQAQNPRADYADAVAGAAPADLVPWSKLLTIPQLVAYAMFRQGEVQVPLRWRMGASATFTKGHLFYAQSAAATAYLFLAEDGRHRKALLEHLYGHYAGRGDPEALFRAVGATPDELGARIVAWCREVVNAPAK